MDCDSPSYYGSQSACSPVCSAPKTKGRGRTPKSACYEAKLKNSIVEDCPGSSRRAASPGSYQCKDQPCTDLAESTANVRLRKELETLMNELQDRDRELAEMVAMQRSHFLAWEKDQQLVIAFREKCANLEEELARERIKLAEVECELQNLQEQHRVTTTMLNRSLDELKRLSQLYKESQKEVQDLQCQVNELTAVKREQAFQLSQLKSRENELQSCLDAKERELQCVRAQLAELEDHVRVLEQSIKDHQAREAQLKREVCEWRQLCNAARQEADQLKEQVAQLNMQLQEKCCELQEARCEIKNLRDELAMAAEREERQYHIINSQRCKQQRTHEELRNLRILYEAQQKELRCLQAKLNCLPPASPTHSYCSRVQMCPSREGCNGSYYNCQSSSKCMNPTPDTCCSRYPSPNRGCR